MSVWHNCSEIAFLSALFFLCSLHSDTNKASLSGYFAIQIIKFRLALWGNKSTIVIILCQWNNIIPKESQKQNVNNMQCIITSYQQSVCKIQSFCLIEITKRNRIDVK